MWNPIDAIIRHYERQAVMNFLRKYWGTIGAIAGPLLVFLEPSLHAYAASHPDGLVAIIIGALITLYHSPAPKDKGK